MGAAALEPEVGARHFKLPLLENSLHAKKSAHNETAVLQLLREVPVECPNMNVQEKSK